MTTLVTILIIEDDEQMRLFLQMSLTAKGFRAIEATTGGEGLTAARTHNPDVILLDLGLPDMDGIDVTKKVRAWARTPIIVISARGREEDKIDALDAGADDYLTKPFGAGELLARIRSAMRRSVFATSTAATVIDVEGVRIDLEKRIVTRDGKEVHLTPNEYNVLALLAKNAGKVMTHGQILKEVWGPGAVDHTHYVRVQLNELRKKLERDPAQPAFLITEPGIGYRMRV